MSGCDCEGSVMRRPWRTRGCCATGEKNVVKIDRSKLQVWGVDARNYHNPYEFREAANLLCLYIKVKQSLYRPGQAQEVQTPIFKDNRHMVVRFSVLCTGRPYPPENILGTHFY